MKAERRPEAPHGTCITLTDDPPSITDPWVSRRARERIQAIDRRCRIARMADELMPMAVYYGPRRPRPVPLGQFLAEGWWAA